MADIKIEIPQDEVDAIIRNKRKARDPKGSLYAVELLLDIQRLTLLNCSLLCLP